eukprot:COSAG01_NODE_2954_length_6801_cov_3.612951_2_plen_321_part_00
MWVEFFAPEHDDWSFIAAHAGAAINSTANGAIAFDKCLANSSAGVFSVWVSDWRPYAPDHACIGCAGCTGCPVESFRFISKWGDATIPANDETTRYLQVALTPPAATTVRSQQRIPFTADCGSIKSMNNTYWDHTKCSSGTGTNACCATVWSPTTAVECCENCKNSAFGWDCVAWEWAAPSCPGCTAACYVCSAEVLPHRGMKIGHVTGCLAEGCEKLDPALPSAAEALSFLKAHRPPQDVTNPGLSDSYLMAAHVKPALAASQAHAWGRAIGGSTDVADPTVEAPTSLFLNNVVPYAFMDEPRYIVSAAVGDWRRLFAK